MCRHGARAPPPSTNHHSRFAFLPPPPRSSTRKFQWTLDARSGIDISVIQWRPGSRVRGGARAAAAGRAGWSLCDSPRAPEGHGARRAPPLLPPPPPPAPAGAARSPGAAAFRGAGVRRERGRAPRSQLASQCLSFLKVQSSAASCWGIYPYLVARRQKFNPHTPTHTPPRSFQPSPVLSGGDGRRAAPSRRGDPRRGLRCRQPEEILRSASDFAPSLCGRGKVPRRAKAEAVFSLILAEPGRRTALLAHIPSRGSAGGFPPRPAALSRRSRLSLLRLLLKPAPVPEGRMLVFFHTGFDLGEIRQMSMENGNRQLSLPPTGAALFPSCHSQQVNGKNAGADEAGGNWNFTLLPGLLLTQC
ncbi:uncharacterized protein LOC142083190 [Calonectris borealis]|uniref:uncharacterized protein LOC142083190 n=1 Tax=Calonectris borealis TaxID=1323832 RepID=UPI003F4C7272